jgi:tetratricopeptide (TPR) repeat protein
MLPMFWAVRAAEVKATEATITLPTYAAGAPEPSPIFYFGRSSQGAQGRVYPYPLYDTLTHTKVNHAYRIVYLENEFIRVGILPEIGGRLFEAVDKSNGYDFVYRQHVIKPALIGLIGAWMSGGLEWNIPHHHRATTFLPVQYRLESNPDGSQTVWVGELELRQRMRWTVGYTLYPGKSYLTAKVRIVNRTPFAQTMLCFANFAVHVNDQYQVIFPPGTQYVTHHGKREFATWPIASGRYAGADFGNGTDVSWYSNHISANSMFAWNYEDDFFAGYDHGKEAGTLSVADHRMVPGKKFWTWGTGPRGRMWDKILTDTDGPYIELMTGAFSDNQPDYSWLEPYETKSFEMNWYPFRDIGGVKNANLDAAVNLETGTNGSVTLGFCTTAAQPDVTVSLKAGNRVVLQENVTITPGQPYLKRLHVAGLTNVYELLATLSARGKELVAYAPRRPEKRQKPEPVIAPPPPGEIKTTEELYLAGRRIEQFHAPGQEPETYWDEALRRDPDDVRVNIALAVRQLKQARFTSAEEHLHAALRRLTKNYTAPKEGEGYYYLGLASQAQGEDASAADNYSRAAWSQSWRGPANFALAELACRRGDFTAALDFVQRSLSANELNLRALTLQAAVLRHLGRANDAVAVARKAQSIDPLDVRAMSELWLANRQNDDEHSQKVPAPIPQQFAAVPPATPASAIVLQSPHASSQGSTRRSIPKPTPSSPPPVAPEATPAKVEAPVKLEIPESMTRLSQALGSFPQTALETAAEYSNAGLWSEGTDVLELALSAVQDKGKRQPLSYYYLAYFADQLGKAQKAREYRALAREADPDYGFPFQWEMIAPLRRAISAAPNDARAPYYLGNLLFDWQPEEAARLWEASAAADTKLPMVHRNLAVAYTHRKPNPDLQAAITQLEAAVAGSPKFALHFKELDELYAATDYSPERRLAVLENNQAVVSKRDDALSREIGLKVFAGKYDDAISLMTGRQFAVWEGGTLDVANHWLQAHLWRGRKELSAGNAAKAIADFERAAKIPDNLPSDQRRSEASPELNYWLGVACDQAGDQARARQLWLEASTRRVLRRNGEPREPDLVQRYFEATAQRKIGQRAEAQDALRDLVKAAQQALSQEAKRALEIQPHGERPERPNRSALAHYAAGLARSGLGEREQARAEFRLALQSAPDCLGARAELDLMGP